VTRILLVIRVKDERKYLAAFFLAFRLSMYVSLHSEIGNESEFQTISDILGKAKRDDTL